MIDSEKVERIYVEILLGIPKDHSQVELDAQYDAVWDRIAVEVAQMRAEGKQFEIPSEIPSEIPDVEPVDGPAKAIRAARKAVGLD